MIIEKLPSAKQSVSHWKKSFRACKGHQDLLPMQKRLVNIHPIRFVFFFFFVLNQEARGEVKTVTFNEYVEALIQVSPLSFVETHFYSWSQSSIVMTLHTYVSFVKLRKMVIKLQLWARVPYMLKEAFILANDWQLIMKNPASFFPPSPAWRWSTHTFCFCAHYCYGSIVNEFRINLL